MTYLAQNGGDLSFTQFFLKNCEPHPYELKRYPLYVKCLLLRANGYSIAQIARMTTVKWQSAWKWTKFEQKPKLAHFLSLYLRLGEPKAGKVWLSVSNTSVMGNVFLRTSGISSNKTAEAHQCPSYLNWCLTHSESSSALRPFSDGLKKLILSLSNLVEYCHEFDCHSKSKT